MKIIIVSLLLICALSCPNNCAECDSKGIHCIACSIGNQLTTIGTCVESSLVAMCTLYGADHQCRACQPTYSLSKGQCVKDYSGCIEYDRNDTSKCLKCAFGTVLNDNRCQGTINCNGSALVCTQCEIGFTLKNGNCVD